MAATNTTGGGAALTASQKAEASMSAADLAALKAAGDKYNAAKAAGDTAAMEAAHREAENIRGGYGYSGGTDGTSYITKSTSSGGGNRDRGGNQSRSGGSNTPTNTTPQTSYYIRDGQRVATNFVDGHNVNQDGSAIQWKAGDISVTPSGQYYIIGDNGAARQVTSNNTNDVLTLMNALGSSNSYTPKGSDTQIQVQQGFEDWLKANDPNAWKQYLNIALEWNAAYTRGDTAAANQLHKQMEDFRKQYGHVGGADGTLTRVVDPEAIPADLQELFAPLIEEYNQALELDLSNLVSTSGAPVYRAPNISESPNAQLVLTEIGKYPALVQAIIRNAPNSVLSYQLSMEFPEYTVGEGMAPMEGLGYEAQYLPQYWNDFTNTYDYEKYADDYDAIRDQLVAANQAGVDLGRMQLEAQLQNALPEYDELRRQNAAAQSRASNNMALYNAANGDRGGIGSKQYSAEQNAYDQRMNEIQLEQQNLINTTNQQIAQLEAEGRMKEAEILAQWGQAKLEAMQEQYNLYWNMYQQGASAMENLEYGIASDEWDRLYKIRQDELEEQLRKYQADVDAYNAAVQRAQTELSVDEANRDYDYQAWRDKANFDLQQAQLENAYNADKYNAAVDQQKLQLNVDEANRDYDWNRWLTDTNLAIQQADKEYERAWERYQFNENLKQIAFENALTKLERGMIGENDLTALGVPADQAKAVAERFNILAQLDIDTARAQLANLRTKSSGSSGGGGGGRTGSYTSEYTGSSPYAGQEETAGGNPSSVMTDAEYAAFQQAAQSGGVPIYDQSGKVVGYAAYQNGRLNPGPLGSNLNYYINVGGRRLYYNPATDDWATAPQPRNQQGNVVAPGSSDAWLRNYGTLTGDTRTTDINAAKANLAQLIGRKVQQLDAAKKNMDSAYTSKVGGLERENGSYAAFKAEYDRVNAELTKLNNLMQGFPG